MTRSGSHVGWCALLLLGLSCPLAAAQMIGQVTAVNAGSASVEINGQNLAVSAGVRVRGEYGGGSGIRWLGDIRQGQVVRFKTAGGLVTSIEVLPGLSEVPQ